MRFQVSDKIPLTSNAPDIQIGVSTDLFKGEKIVLTNCCKTKLTPKVASKVSRGPGSLRTNLIDNLYNISANDITNNVKIKNV